MKKIFRRKKNRVKLPYFKVNKTISSMSEVVDWGLRVQNIPETWSKTSGEGINVYVLDTAGFTNHPDLISNYLGGKNFTNSNTIRDLNGHGTHCAGIISASQNNIGMVGVAPKSKVYLIKVLSDNGSGAIKYIEDGLQYCIDSLQAENPAHIVSMSLGGDYPMGNKIELLIKKLYELNIPVVCAAGNSGREGINYPAKYKETIAIGAFDESGRLANFSTTGSELDFVAPGVDIYSTWVNDSYASISGTSMATPFVAGIIALMLSKHKKQEEQTGFNDCKTVADIKNHLIKHSIDQGKIGKDKNWGYGIIDVENLIESKLDKINPEEEKINIRKNFFYKLFDFIKRYLLGR